MQVEIVARNGELWSGTASSVVVPALSGEMGILAGHTPLLAVLTAGTVQIKGTDDGVDRAIAIGPGFVTVDSDVITIVVDSTDDVEMDLTDFME